MTSVIVNRGGVDDFFDYDLEFANINNQGNKPIFRGMNWLCLTTGYIYSIVNRKDDWYFKYNIENSNLILLPENIVSHKKNQKM